ncbi:methyltransferase domain-containing protein [Pendulispora rubella]|uniref:Methyltransferase domain-containing protein n=1 Tax=Pendulispora rubella TaxID=2741070 RepID=A0ABZ2L6B9_9BACT
MASDNKVPKYVVEEVNYALTDAIGRPRTVLDVGCGIGTNGKVARDHGAHVVGIEIVPESAARAREVLDEVYSVNIETDEVLDALKGRKFDLILFADVLEHTVNPLAVLARLSNLLEDGGHVIVSLPNVAAWTVRLGLLAGNFTYEPSGILDDSHLRFFTRETAMRLVEESGLEIMRVDLNPMLVRAAKPLIRKQLLEKQSNGEVDPLALSKSSLYQAYMQFVRPVEGLVAKSAPGLLAFQCVIVARKPPRTKKLSLTVGMLTLNEEESVEKMIDEIRDVAPDAEILLVDGSSDRTPELAAAKGARVIRQLPPRGHGPAMELLMYEAAKQSDALIYLDCDFTYPTQMIPRIRGLLEQGADVVNASRTYHYPKAMPVPNFLANRFFAATAYAVHGVPTTDVHSGMRGYRSSVIRAFDFDGSGDALPLDTLILPAKSNYNIVEVPIDYNERVGVSKLAKLRGTAWTFIRIATAVGKGERVQSGRRYRHVAG